LSPGKAALAGAATAARVASASATADDKRMPLLRIIAPTRAVGPLRDRSANATGATSDGGTYVCGLCLVAIEIGFLCLSLTLRGARDVAGA
jgi:hypothetical protein